MPHRRLNALTGEWVSVSPQRNQRPWQGREESIHTSVLPAHDPQCYLCPGNTRANGVLNPQYRSTWTFENDFAAFLPSPSAPLVADSPLLQAQLHRGECRVLCFSPRHDVTLAQMGVAQIRLVVDAWAQQVAELGQRWRWVQIFENKGELMGCSNAHPHGQIWATDFVPTEPAKEGAQQQRWWQERGTPLLLDYLATEESSEERVVLRTQHWLAVVPWWAVWPFETLLLPRQHVRQLTDLNDEQRDDLAMTVRQLLRGYDELFGVSFPYSMGWHGAPTDGGDHPGWQLHAHVFPPLLRSASVRKFMVGFEMLGEPQRDLTAEQAAARLREWM